MGAGRGGGGEKKQSVPSTAKEYPGLVVTRTDLDPSGTSTALVSDSDSADYAESAFEQRPAEISLSEYIHPTIETAGRQP